MCVCECRFTPRSYARPKARTNLYTLQLQDLLEKGKLYDEMSIEGLLDKADKKMQEQHAQEVATAKAAAERAAQAGRIAGRPLRKAKADAPPALGSPMPSQGMVAVSGAPAPGVPQLFAGVPVSQGQFPGQGLPLQSFQSQGHLGSLQPMASHRFPTNTAYNQVGGARGAGVQG